MNAVSDMLVPSSGSGVSISDGVLTALTNNTVECGIVFPVKPDTKYTAGFTKLTGGNLYVRCAEYSDKPGVYASQYRLRTIIEDGSASSGNISRTFTTGTGAKYVFFGFRRTYATATITADKWFACLYGAGNAYTQYQGTTYPISWETEAGTVYGGTLTINEDGSVDLVSTMAATNLGSYTWVYSANGFFESGRNYSAANTKDKITIMCEVYKALKNQTYQTSVDKTIWIASSSPASYTYFRVRDTSFNGDADALKTAMSGHYAIYLLKTPTTYHLDSIAQISTIVGENNIWTDVNGTITLTYLAEAE